MPTGDLMKRYLEMKRDAKNTKKYVGTVQNPFGLEHSGLVIPNQDTPGHVEALVMLMIVEIGDDPNREGLLDTPARVAKAWEEMFAGYKVTNPEELLKTFEDGAEGCDEMIVVRDIEFVSHCEHHLMPFTGNVTIGYLPDKRIVGLSKVPRVVDAYAKRLQVQERLTTQIADAIQDGLKPKGVGVIIEAFHSCLSCRGVRKQNAAMVTSALRGAFKDDENTRAEFLNLYGKRR